jgi:hypothetical protein
LAKATLLLPESAGLLSKSAGLLSKSTGLALAEAPGLPNAARRASTEEPCKATQAATSATSELT